MLRRDALRQANPEAYELMRAGYRYIGTKPPDRKKAYECFNQAYRQHGSTLIVPFLYILEKELGLSSINLDLPRLAAETKDLKIVLCYCSLLSVEGKDEEFQAQIKRMADPSSPYSLFIEAKDFFSKGNHVAGMILLKRAGSMGDAACCTAVAKMALDKLTRHSDSYREALYWYQQALIHCDFVEELDILAHTWTVPEVYNDDQNLSMLLSCLDQLPSWDKVESQSKSDSYIMHLLMRSLNIEHRRERLLREMDDPSPCESIIKMAEIKDVIRSSELLSTDLLKTACSYLPGAIDPFCL
jgi:hypothetical protein